ncbi:3-demethylubiquinone-9 3-methyltransferase [Legionella moravica]|uniref:Ubiquinone biosynthesis O-methyltransferase n=1 Tax=Legionella moravica TaxID=39962 RepID=A0A378JV65_9GAMM|nr:bifunctional 2-polyprenyl-6-hydroxyphenol methylase/3-demethylubiquinol 3-O-methyltransferase UbiG [Legionella moravica]KTD35283.1 3-demethylubiquinone-9 3-methyltransferase [Legionella moravica]STX62605.1 3-demethylubiquinone-9 3-methyltransferase [Legionella moravica]
MINSESTIDKQELDKFAQHAAQWWDTEGPLKTLHDINSTRLDFISQHVKLNDIRVLDVGCGGGILCESMARRGADVIGIDAEAEAIKAAEEHARNNGLSVRYLCTPIEDYEDNAFDVITCMEMLEHVHRPEQVLHHCRRLLKPDGLLFLSTINRTPKAYASAIIAAEYVLNLLPKQTHDYDKFIKPSELAAMTRSYGFDLIDLKGLHYNPIARTCALAADVSVNYLMALRPGE